MKPDVFGSFVGGEHEYRIYSSDFLHRLKKLNYVTLNGETMLNSRINCAETTIGIVMVFEVV